MMATETCPDGSDNGPGNVTSIAQAQSAAHWHTRCRPTDAKLAASKRRAGSRFLDAREGTGPSVASKTFARRGASCLASRCSGPVEVPTGGRPPSLLHAGKGRQQEGHLSTFFALGVTSFPQGSKAADLGKHRPRAARATHAPSPPAYDAVGPLLDVPSFVELSSPRSRFSWWSCPAARVEALRANARATRAAARPSR
jgi:hypothetical protein